MQDSGNTIPLLLVSGFLGAGKTTFLLHLIDLLRSPAGARRPEKQGRPVPFPVIDEAHPLLMVENDFGDVSFDASLMREARVTVTELTHGCICCSLAGDFTRSLERACQDYQPALVLIEPSGLGRLSEIQKELARPPLDNLFTVLPAVTILDFRSFASYYRNFSAFYLDQILAADRILLNRLSEMPEAEIRKNRDTLTKFVSPDKLQAFDVEGAGDAAYRALWEDLFCPAASVVREEGKVSLGLVPPEEKGHHEGGQQGHGHHHEDGMKEDHDHHHGHQHYHNHPHEGGEQAHDHHHHHHHHDDNWQSLSLTLPELTVEKWQALFAAFEAAYPLTLVRAKGLVKTPEGLCLLQVVPGETRLTPLNRQRKARLVREGHKGRGSLLHKKGRGNLFAASHVGSADPTDDAGARQDSLLQAGMEPGKVSFIFQGVDAKDFQEAFLSFALQGSHGHPDGHGRN